jgi:hypothetical protein
VTRVSRGTTYLIHIQLYSGTVTRIKYDVHRDTRVTVPLYNCICIKYVVPRDTRVRVPLCNCICIKYVVHRDTRDNDIVVL